MLTTVRLHGALARLAGRATWTLDVMSPGEALRAIDAQTEERLRAHLIAKENEGIEYRVVCDGKDVAGDHPRIAGVTKQHYQTIDFIPVPAGASAGLWETIAGAVLVVVGVVMALTGYGTAIAPYVIMAGIGLLAGGIMQMFFGPKAPVVASHASKERGDGGGEQSYLFSGPVNTINQGGAVPILYGRMIVGSQTISAGIRTASVVLEGEVDTGDEHRDLQKEYLNDALNITNSKTTRDNKDDSND